MEETEESQRERSALERERRALLDKRYGGEGTSPEEDARFEQIDRRLDELDEPLVGVMLGPLEALAAESEVLAARVWCAVHEIGAMMRTGPPSRLHRYIVRGARVRMRAYAARARRR